MDEIAVLIDCDRTSTARGFITFVNKQTMIDATLREGMYQAALLPWERRLYRAKAIPVRDGAGTVNSGDWTYTGTSFWDVELPPDNWLTRHKKRDPR